MIFILMMEILHRLFSRAASLGMFEPLANIALKQRVSMFADDVMLFIRPREVELRACAQILHDFGLASGLRVNFQKSAALPIRCSPEQVQLTHSLLGCTIGTYPCRYLGIPLSIRKCSAAQFNFLVDKLANQLPTWRGSSLPKSGWLLLIQSVLCSIPIHTLMALELPAKTLLALEKICRGFLWCAQREAHGGKCSVAWEQVCTPKWAGGLGIPNLRWLNHALQARWLWLQRTDDQRPWKDLDISVSEEARGIYQAAVQAHLGNGNDILFWEDRWIR